MSNVKNNKRGFALPLTMALVSAMVALTGLLYLAGAVFLPYQRAMILQEKVRQLALGGVQIGMSQLSRSFEPEKKADTNDASAQKPPEPDIGPAQFLAYLLANLYKWQTIDLIKSRDGIAGQIKLCISVEEGKINLNQMYDFKNHRFIDLGSAKEGWKTVIAEIIKRIEKKMNVTGLFAPLEAFLRKRTAPLNDVTELLAIPEFGAFKNNIFYEPSLPETAETKEKSEKNKPLYLTDIFTVATDRPQIEPWVISDSLLTGLDLSRASLEGKNTAVLMEQTLKGFKKNSAIKDLWSSKLGKIYGKELQSLPKNIESVLSTAFEPKNFCIRVTATSGSLMQQLCAIVERRPHASAGQSSRLYDVVIKRLYWL